MEIRFIGNTAHKKIRDFYLQTHSDGDWRNFLSELDDGVRITYEKLPYVLTRIGMDLNDVTQIGWPDQRFKQLAELCEQLDNFTLSMLCSELRTILPQKIICMDESDPIERVREVGVIRNKGWPRSEIRGELGFHFKPKSSVGIPLEGMVELSKILKISLHWILFWNKDTPVYSKNPRIDLLLDLFSFGSDQVQKGFLGAVKELVRSSKQQEYRGG